MTIDVEDYFHVSAFERHLSRDDWERFESRVCNNTDRLLEIFAGAGVTATFFILGWVAERYPMLVRRIAAGGHEVASHGYAHRLVYEMTQEEFCEDVHRAKCLLEDLCGSQVHGYRAPSYSITRASLWALDVLVEQGYAYDAGVFPIYHDRYGIPDAPRHPYRIERSLGSIWEFPGSTVRWGSQNLPIGGGGYFRLLPYGWTQRGIRHVNGVEQKAVMFYLHPWEVDPQQPRIKTSLFSQFRHYTNLGKTESKLQQLLGEFEFDTALSVLAHATSAEVVTAGLPAIALA